MQIDGWLVSGPCQVVCARNRLLFTDLLRTGTDRRAVINFILLDIANNVIAGCALCPFDSLYVCLQGKMQSAPKPFQYCFFDNTFDEKTHSELLKIASRAVERMEKQHSLRKDTEIFLSTVCRRGKLRYDIRLPPRSTKSLSVTRELREKIVSLLGDDFVARPPHVLVAYKGAEAQPFHTDVDPLFDDDDGDNERSVSHPPFYLTLIAALQDVLDPSMGPTEFEDGKLALLKANQSVLFDGLAVHRGGDALVDRPPLVYQVFHRRWYRDANE